MTTILTCDKCGLVYRAGLLPHKCAEWTKGQRITYQCPNCGQIDSHAADCPSNPQRYEHDAPAAPERGKWRVVDVGRNIYIEREGESPFICDMQTSDCSNGERLEARQLADQIVREHHQHSTLVAQRERLTQAAQSVVERLKDLPRFLEKNDSATLASITAEALADLAVAIPAEMITTSEQEGRRAQR